MSTSLQHCSCHPSPTWPGSLSSPVTGLLPAEDFPPALLPYSAVMATLRGQEDCPSSGGRACPSPCSTALWLRAPVPGPPPPLSPASACFPPPPGVAALKMGLRLLAQLSSCPRQGPTASSSQAGRLCCQRKEAAQAGRKEDRKSPGGDGGGASPPPPRPSDGSWAQEPLEESGGQERGGADDDSRSPLPPSLYLPPSRGHQGPGGGELQRSSPFSSAESRFFLQSQGRKTKTAAKDLLCSWGWTF